MTCDVPSGTVRDNLMPLPYKEPSQVLSALLERITEEGRRLAAIADLNISDMSAQAPVGTTLALLERQLKVLTAVQARTHYSLKQEIGLLKNLIRHYTDPDYTYDPEYGSKKAKKAIHGVVKLEVVEKNMDKIHPDKLADIIEDLKHVHREKIANLLSHQKAAHVFERVTPELQHILLKHWGPKKASKILSRVSIKQVISIIKKLPKDEAEIFMSYLKEKNEI